MRATDSLAFLGRFATLMFAAALPRRAKRGDGKVATFSFNRRACMEGMKYCIVRTYSAGVFAGYIEYRKDQEVVLREARRIWYWEGAATLSQLAQSGTSLPEKCKFPEPVDRITVLGTIEILDCTEKAKESIASVPIWRA